MENHTRTTARFEQMCQSFIKTVKESRGGIPEERQAESIDQLVLIFGVFYANFKTVPGTTYPGLRSGDETGGYQAELREWVEEQCQNLGGALALNNPYVSTKLFELADCFEDQDIDRVHEVWRTVQAALKCVLAQLRVKSTDELGKPRLPERTREVLETIREYGPIQEKDIEKRLSIIVASGTIRKWDIPVLKEHFGVESSGEGYHIP